MNPRAVAFVACRLFAIYIFIFNVLGLVVAVGAASLTPGAFISWIAALMAVPFALVSACLWFGASWFARGISLPAPSNDLPASLSFDDWQALVIGAVGWLTALHAAKVIVQALKLRVGEGSVNSAVSLLTGDIEQSQFVRILILGLVFLVISVVLILIPRKIVIGLNRFRSWGGESIITDADI